MLVEDDENPKALLNTLHSVGESWSQAVDTPEWFSRPARPFHVLFNVSETQWEGVARIVRAAAAANVPVRTDQ